jgi:hypothetical protein
LTISLLAFLPLRIGRPGRFVSEFVAALAVVRELAAGATIGLEPAAPALVVSAQEP